jgi:hypothetical protein
MGPDSPVGDRFERTTVNATDPLAVACAIQLAVDGGVK